MNKAAYEAKLAATVITDDMTVAQARKRKQAKNALRRFWEKAALKWVRENKGIDLEEARAHWTDFKVKTDFKPTGTVTVEQWSDVDYPWQKPSLLRTFRVPKRELLKEN